MTALLDSDTLDEMTDGDVEMQRSLLTMFLEQSNQQIKSLTNAYHAKELSLLADALHKLKSSSKMIGALTLSEHCQILEEKARSGSENFNNQQFKEMVVCFKETIAEINHIIK